MVKADSLKVLKKGKAARVIFFYTGEEGTYVDQPDVTLYENGIVHIESPLEVTTTHLQNCEILWNFQADGTGADGSPEDPSKKVRLLKPR